MVVFNTAVLHDKMGSQKDVENRMKVTWRQEKSDLRGERGV